MHGWAGCCAVCRSADDRGTKSEPVQQPLLPSRDAGAQARNDSSVHVGRTGSKDRARTQQAPKIAHAASLSDMRMPVVVGKRDHEAKDLLAEELNGSGRQLASSPSAAEPPGEKEPCKKTEVATAESADEVEDKPPRSEQKQGKKKAHHNSGGDDLMPFRKVHRRRDAIVGGDGETAGAVHEIRTASRESPTAASTSAGEESEPLVPQRRRSMAAAEDFLSSLASPEVEGSTVISMGNPPQLQQVVVRGPCWSWGDEDGGPGKPGTVWSISKETGTVTVFWHETQNIRDHYQYAARSDLCVSEHLASSASLITTPASGPSSAGAGSQRKSIIGRAVTGAKSAFTSSSRKDRRDASPGRREASPSLSDTPVASADAVAMPMQRRCSQVSFASRSQAIIIFDWDDTLFPTTYVRDDLALPWNKTLEEQRFSSKAECTRLLKDCSSNAEKVLRLANTLGKVVLVTLAKRPWVLESCKNYYPRIGKLIEELSLPIVYAQEGSEDVIDYDKRAMMSSEEVEMHYASMKGKAIAREIASFYSRYEGQSWKNIISVGDADFERYGTFGAVEAYMKQHGLLHAMQKNALLKAGGHMEEMVDAEGHVFRIRAKIFKMMDQPTAEELLVELQLFHRWLPHLVLFNDGCDLVLDALDDPSQIRAIEAKLGIHSTAAAPQGGSRRPASPASTNKRSTSKESSGSNSKGRSWSMPRRPSVGSASSCGSQSTAGGSQRPASASSSPSSTKGRGIAASVASWATGNRRRATK